MTDQDKMSEGRTPFCPHCKEVVVPRYLRENCHIPMCAKLSELRAELSRRAPVLSKSESAALEWADRRMATEGQPESLYSTILAATVRRLTGEEKGGCGGTNCKNECCRGRITP